MSSTGTAHVGGGKKAFPKGGGEQLVMRCGATLDERPGLPLDGNRLADLHADEDLCPKCLEDLREDDATIPGFLVDGEVVARV